MDFTIATKLFAALFAIMNPLSTLPVFLALTADLTPEDRRSAMLSMLVTIVVGALVCAIAGQFLLAMFGIDVQNFRLAGGLIVLLIALNMLNGEESSAHHGTDEEKDNFKAASSSGVYPLGIPLTFGPGTIATLIIFAPYTHTFEGAVGYYAGLVGYLVFFGILLVLAPSIAKWLSPMALSISRRIMGMILAAIAAEMMTGAMGKLFPAWLG
ncbi:MAG: MarC family protein [Xanthobacter sp.]